MADSSPFVDRPSRAQSKHGSPFRRISFNSNNGGGATNNDPTYDELKSQINSLNYLISDLKNQVELGKIESEQKINELTKELSQQHLKNDNISSDQVFLYNQNKELQSKLTHVNENFTEEREKYENEIRTLKTDLFNYKKQYDEVQSESKYKLSQVEQEQHNNQAQIQNLNQLNTELSNELDAKNDLINKLKLKFNEQNTTIEKLNSDLMSIPSRDEIASVETIKKQLSEQISYIQELEMKNLTQAEQIKKLTLNKQNVEILKEEKASLTKKLGKIDELNDTINDLNLQVLNLQQENSKWKVYLNEDDDVKIEEFVKNFKLIKDENILLKGNFNKVDTELKSFKNTYNELFITHETLNKNSQALTKSYSNLEKLNNEIEQQKNLAFEESNFLREQLKNLDQELSLNEDDKNKYIRNLEGLVDEYKNKINELTKQIPKDSSSNKRQRTEDDENDEDTTRNFQKSVSRLEDENFQLNNKFSKLLNENSVLLKKIESFQDIKEKKIRILQLRNNPYSNDQFIKKELIDTLTKENNDLLNKTPLGETIPKSIYDRSQLENQALERKIHDLNKRIQRLREIFSAKSLEFIDAVYSLIGFKLEFLPSNKIKLISKYVKNDKNCLLIDPVKQTFKTSKDNDEDDEFFQTCDTLIDFWIKEKNDIPSFLAALNLELFEKQQSREQQV
ncbi:hypothetical protein WICANDRAFT_104658 [Wickerhamomyces anomalus NRRL Y-366-8]|uniref:Spindle assembly checkpoint component MAD1 n=1 Tax=Wickerhamomyces anomalus (strain ATCC 58044 / CBS 1984 / NCYC 433 / NRRL Y-366-8) TaxID=683960 RepID=A0A1E3P276_WICAA|nr:uncharacterized protein WICANDRAFT_104658 [Wickerhamomyces anomalus NRRL Y-366-8]ODQ59571.1 hypothetical protein WICANDRAFT_104658 [Wickerhamomyces anomalus NRRL Y-366-8]